MPEPQIRFCTSADGTRIAYATYGEGGGTSLLLARDWPFGQEKSWEFPQERALHEELAAGRVLVTYDLRGVGASQREIKDLTLEAQLADISAVVEHAQLKRFHLYAYNRVSAAYAAQQPERVASLILSEPSLRGEDTLPSEALRTSIEAIRMNWSLARRAMATVVFPDGPTDLQRRWSDMARDSISPEVAVMHLKFDATLDISEFLPRIEVPTLVLHFRGEKGTSASAARAVASLIPNARLLSLNLAKTVWYNDPPAIASVIRQFLDEVERASRPAERTRAQPLPEPKSYASGRYAVQRLLGEGGQKTVFLARDTQLGRDVAVALLKAEGIDDASLARLRREAQALARLEAQPNIVAIYDIGEHEGRPFTVCEYLAGGTLEQELGRAGGALPAERAVAIARDVCHALVVAHGGDIIHRDIKPSNIWLTASGSAKLGDFGLATALDRSRVTQAGTIMGTAAYMAPEQALGGEIDQRSDIYSLGCVLYEMLTGRPLFVADTAVAVVSQHINASPVPPSDLQPGLPRSVERLAMQMLAKAPEDRPQTAAEVLAALEGNAPTTNDAPAPVRTSPVVTEPQVRYCTTEDGVSIAYWTLGEGTPLVHMPDGPWSHLTVEWQQPETRRWYEGLADGRMLVRYDGRGTGLSERKVSEFSLETMMRDLEAVVGQLSLTQFDLYAITSAGQVAISYAVRHPESVSHLVLWLCAARSLDWLAMPQSRALDRMGERDWELFTETAARFSVGWEQEEFARSLAAAMREAVTPDTMAAMYDAIRPLDVSDILSEVRAATLVLHRREFRWQTIEIPKRLAAAIPGARMVVLEGSAGAPFLENADQALETVDNFLRGGPRAGN